MDDHDKMDISLNTDFDASLLTCWDSHSNTNASSRNHSQKNGGSKASSSPSPAPNHASRRDSWDSNGYAQLPSFTMEEEVQKFALPGTTGNTDSDVNEDNDNPKNENSTDLHWQENQQRHLLAAEAAGLVQPVHQHMPSVSNNANSYNDIINTDNGNNRSPIPVSTGTSVASGLNGATNNFFAKQHTRYKNASDQSVSSATPSNNKSLSRTQMHPLAIPSSADCPQMQSVASAKNAFLPMALSQLGGNAAAALAAAGLTTAAANMNTSQHQGQQEAQQQLNNLLFSTQALHLQQQLIHADKSASLEQPQQPSQQRQQQAQQQSGTQQSSAEISATSSPPPFYLFDAPVELRVNFMQSQRMHGLTVTEDSNSYHYGVAVNGFHPQINGQTNPARANMLGTVGPKRHKPTVQLIDARHNNRKSGRIKNEREQRRAQKITELIDQLRGEMETGGWKIEVKSKFHTLSSCAEYVKHLIKKNKDKEEVVSKAKADMQMKHCKMEEDKAVQSRSDPESVMSSLTASTGGSAISTSNRLNKVSLEQSSEEGQRKRKASVKDSSSSKKSRRAKRSSSSGDDQNCQDSKQQSLDKATSSVSDTTESNRGSSKSGSDAKSSSQEKDIDDGSGTASSLSASSNAFMKDNGNRKYCTKHADVVVKGHSNHKYRLPGEITSIEDSFVLDYEEVFVKSNVPQIVATTSGKIISWNDFFLKATGMSRKSAHGLTIFSLVKQEKLSNLFEIVARALRKEDVDSNSSAISAENTKNSDEASQNPFSGTKWAYDTMTLPCIEFPAIRARFSNGENTNPLYITVTLMQDEDHQKRLFHCIFTDCPGANGALGSVTPELLKMMFTRHRKHNRKADSRAGEKTGQTIR